MKLTCRALTQTGFVFAILLIIYLTFQSDTVLAVNVQRWVSDGTVDYWFKVLCCFGALFAWCMAFKHWLGLKKLIDIGNGKYSVKSDKGKEDG